MFYEVCCSLVYLSTIANTGEGWILVLLLLKPLAPLLDGAFTAAGMTCACAAQRQGKRDSDMIGHLQR